MTTGKTEEQASLLWLSNLLDTLRKECPWDRAQTTASLRYLTIEECYELSEAILQHNDDETRKELGDLFMHLLFYAKISEEKGSFSLSDVIDGICRKLTARHPHIALPDREGHLQPAKVPQAPRWEEVKMKEGRHSVLEGVPATLPPLVKCVRMQEKAAGTGYEFRSEPEAFAKVQEEYGELREALEEREALRNQEVMAGREAMTKEGPGNGQPQPSSAKEADGNNGQPQPSSAREAAQQHVEEEFGDLLFILVKWGRFLGVNADDALSKANQKFYRRFTYMEQAAAKQGRTLPQLAKEEMQALWREAKTHGL